MATGLPRDRTRQIWRAAAAAADDPALLTPLDADERRRHGQPPGTTGDELHLTARAMLADRAGRGA